MKNRYKKKNAIIAAAKARIAAGSIDEMDVYSSIHGTTTRRPRFGDDRVAAANSHEAAVRRALDKASASLLEFRLANTPGCIVDGCPLAVDRVEVVLLGLIESDHRDQSMKISEVSRMHHSLRQAEVEKTDALCIWHHFVKTRKQSNHTDAPNRHHRLARKLAALKIRHGCQHPCHSMMPYSSLVPDGDIDPLVAGFLDVSHLKRGKLQKGYASSLADLEEGRAEVHCKFCHRMFTSCERAKLTDAPFAQHQFGSLLKLVPSFVQHFDQVTASFDWAAERARISAKVSLSQRGRKRKRESIEP